MKKNYSAKAFIVSGPSGVGKTTLVNEVLKRIQSSPVKRVVTYTCRPPRSGERNGVDYHFVSRNEFEQKIKNNFFLETTNYISSPYASPASSLTELETGTSLIFVIDRPGAHNISHQIKHSVLIWVTPPSIDILKNRLKKRASESSTQLEKRLEQASQEIEEENKKQRFFTYHIVNDVFDEAVEQLKAIIEDELVKR